MANIGLHETLQTQQSLICYFDYRSLNLQIKNWLHHEINEIEVILIYRGSSIKGQREISFNVYIEDPMAERLLIFY